jgi:hypothetical protein
MDALTRFLEANPFEPVLTFKTFSGEDIHYLATDVVQIDCLDSSRWLMSKARPAL